MEEENEIDYKPKYDKEFTRRLKMPKTEISDIKINPVDPTYFYVFKIQTVEKETKIINYTATEDKFYDRMAEVREQERDSEDSDFDSDDDAMSGDLFEKTLAYMRNNKIYSVGKDGKAKENLDTGIQGAGQDLNKLLSNRAMSRIDGATNQSRGGIRVRTKTNLKGLVPGFGTKKGPKPVSVIIEKSGEDQSNSLSDDTPLEKYSESDEGEESEESEESETPESSGQQASNESSEEEEYDGSSSEEDDEGGSRDSKHFEGGNSDKSSVEEPVGGLNPQSREVRVNEDSKVLEEEAKRNQMATEEPMVGSDEHIHRDSDVPLKSKDNADSKKEKDGILSNLKNPLDMGKGKSSKNQKDGDAKEADAAANQDQPEQDDDQIDKNAIESYEFERIRSENSGMVIKKFRNVLMCCKFEQYGYSIKQKLYADEMGNDVQGEFKFSSRMVFSSCGQYFATYTGNKYIIYQAKSLKMVKTFELDNFVEDVEYYYGNDDNKFLSSDAKFLASKNYSSIFVYRAYSNDGGEQVSQYTNGNVTFHGFMNSSYLIGVVNEIDTSYITKVDVTNEEFRLEKINGSYYDEDITQFISNIKFNPKGKACAFVVNENVLYFLDLSRRNSTPQKVLERFDRIIYDVDSDRISMAYMQDNQGYIALYKNVFMFRKRYDNFYNLHSIDSDDNNEIIYIEGYGPYKTIHTFDEHNSSTIKFEPKIRFHYPFVFYEYERNELWFQNIEEKDIIHRFVFVNTVSALNCIDTVNTGFCYQNAPKLFIKLILSFEADHKIAYLDIDFDADDYDLEEGDKILSANVTRYTKSIKFTELPNADILSFIEMTGKNEKNLTETCFLFHFPSQLKLYFFKSGKIKKSFEKIYQRRNIVSFNKRTFFWEDKGRYIERMENDISKDEKHYFYKAYDAKNVMKMCKKIDYHRHKECLLVCDEDKFVKILSYDEGNKKFDVEKEYYVNEMFGLYEDLDALNTYYLAKGMLYKNDQTYLLQERGNEKVSNCVSINEPANFRYNTRQFPLVSNSHIIKSMEDYTYSGKNEFYICSPYNSNKIPNVEHYILGLEWFSPDQKDKIIRVKLLHDYQINISLNTANGDVLETFPVYYYAENLEITPSQDGRYLMIYSQDGNDEDKDPKVNWKAYEICIRAPDEEGKAERREKDENGFDRINEEDTKEGSSGARKDVFEVIEIRSGTVEAHFDGILFDEIKMAILNTGDMVAAHMETKTLMFNKHNFYDRVSGAILNHSDGLSRNDDTGGFRVDSDDVKIGQSYILMKFASSLVSFRFEADPEHPDRPPSVHSFKKLGAQMVTEYKGIELDDIIITSHPSKVLLKYSFEEVKGATEKHNILVWDIEKDEEMSSFTSRDNDEFLFYVYCPIEEVTESILHRASTGDKYNRDPKLARKLKAEAKRKQASNRRQVYQEDEPEGGQDADAAGEGDQEQDHEDEPADAETSDRYRVSETGYLVFDQYYVNLDSMVPSPFMQFEGEDLAREHYQFGPKMNFDESLAVVNGKAISAFSYLDIEFRSKRQIYHGNPSICKYFVNGKSIVSDYILEDEKLEKVLEFLEEDPIYLLMILTPDYKNKTPLDEAIENNSPKVVEMLLGSILKLEGFKLSNSFKHRFLELFDMGVEAFRQYISLCYFRTGQMEFMK